ncbi:MAG: hypothetical protein GAK43_01637 [Stenotrophomonas maltophilia]|nr:MAG: hypothetical protein GAK43_01637 [Stenotrophomonas maltophilia]
MLGHEVAFQQALVVGRQLFGDGQGLPQRGDGGLGGRYLGIALFDHGLGLADIAAQLQVLALQPQLRTAKLLGIGTFDLAGFQVRFLARRKAAEQGAGPGEVHPRRKQVAFQAFDIRARLARVQLHQQIACLDRLPVVDVDGLDHRDFLGLDELGLAAGYDLALGGGHHIDLPDAGPQQGQGGEGHDRPFDIARQRADGLFLQRQGCRQELDFMR